MKSKSRLMLLNVRDALLGLLGDGSRYLSHLFVGAGVFAALLIALLAWGATSVVKFTNESGEDLRAVAVFEKSLEGDESPLWVLNLAARESTYRVTVTCCDWLVIQYRLSDQYYDRHCRHSDYTEFPEFDIVFPREGGAYCRNCRNCSDGGVEG